VTEIERNTKLVKTKGLCPPPSKCTAVSPPAEKRAGAAFRPTLKHPGPILLQEDEDPPGENFFL
jgi:hypothetical protein